MSIQDSGTRLLCLSIAVLVLGLAVFGIPGMALAKTFQVNETTDRPDADYADGECDCDLLLNGNQCSLRAAIMQSRMLGSHTILLGPYNYVLTISGDDSNRGDMGDLDIYGTGVLTITGTRSLLGNSVIMAQGSDDRIFDIYDKTVTITGVTIRGGTADRTGGGIRVSTGADLTLENATIEDCVAGTGGGGLSVFTSATLKDVIIQNNSVTGNLRTGGGIANFGTLGIEGVIVRNNQTENGSGGGIAVGLGATLTGIDLQIESNNALHGGPGGEADGGGFQTEGIVRLRASVISDNYALGSGGGVACSDDGALDFEDVSILRNVSDNGGGGIWVAGTGIADLNLCTVGNNKASTSGGGGIHNDGAVTIDSSTVHGNLAMTGAGILNSPISIQLRLAYSTVNNNQATASFATGAGIWNGGPQLDVFNSTISGNSAQQGAGIVNIASGTCQVSHTTIARNLATSTGGVHNDGVFEIRNSILADNTGGNCGGSTALLSDGYNLDSGAGCGLSNTGDLSNADPLLGPLQDNGGPTATHGIPLNSPAIDAGTCNDLLGAVVSNDQRGEMRPEDGDGNSVPECDIGAYETRICFAYGDVDSDGIALAVGDIIYLVRFILGLGTPLPSAQDSDLNGDCRLDVLDALVFIDYFRIGLPAFGTYPVPTCCDFTEVRPALTGHSVKSAFRVLGPASGTGWSWTIIGTGVNVSDLNVPGVPVGGSAAELAQAWANSINAAGSPDATATAIGNVFTVTVPASPAFTLCMGDFGQTPGCCIPPDLYCTFNPGLEEVPLSNNDCNDNGIDDAIDIASGTSDDLNGNGIPDDAEIYTICIDTVRTLNGQTVEMDVLRTGWNCGLTMGGFDLLIEYDQSALSFLGASRGALLDSLEWEYFTYRTGAGGNCPGGCPDGLVRLVAIADLDNGPTQHPVVSGVPGVLASLQFQASSDRNLIGQCVPVSFYWNDCGDNAVASISGDTTSLDRRIYGPTGNLLWDEDDDDQFPDDARPQGLGASDLCLEGGGPDKPAPIRTLIFCNGWICIDEPPDDRGDINLNGIANEVGDAVLFSAYFIHGNSVWDPIFMESQILATDINDDGVVLTVADLVYLIRIITGDEQPFPPGGHPKLTPQQLTASVDWQIDNNGLTVNWSAKSDAGAILLAFDHNGARFGEPVLEDRASGMTVISHDDGSQLRVLIYSMEKGASIAAGDGAILTVPVLAPGNDLSLTESEAADYAGIPIGVEFAKSASVPKSFGLLQNVPNPFNASTRISFTLRDAGDVTISVFDVLGRKVATLVDGYLEPGLHHITWDARGSQGEELASGVYFYRIVTASHQASRKMVLLK